MHVYDIALRVSDYDAVDGTIALEYLQLNV